MCYYSLLQQKTNPRIRPRIRMKSHSLKRHYAIGGSATMTPDQRKRTWRMRPVDSRPSSAWLLWLRLQPWRMCTGKLGNLSISWPWWCVSVDNKHLCACSRAQRAVSIPTEGQVKDMAPVLISCADQWGVSLARDGFSPDWAYVRTCWGLILDPRPKMPGERANESERDWKGMREALSRMKMFYPRSFYTQPHPPSLSLTPSGPWGSQFWSLRLFPLVAPDQLSDFTICKKWLLFKVKFCLQKVHLKQVLPLLSFSVFMFLFLVSFIAQTSFSHSSVHLLSVRGTFCGFLPPFLALNLTKRERMSVFRLLNLSLIPHKPVQICSLHRSTTFTFIMHSWCLDASFFQAMTLNVSGASVDDSCSVINHLFSTHREQRRVGGGSRMFARAALQSMSRVQN